jgi:CRISPR system Cascade subunit CasC
MGAGHINSQELTSGLFYSYVVIDVPLLVSNLEGCSREEWLDADRTLAAAVVERFVQLMATVSPGAKLGSTAPYSYAQCMIGEAGTAQPRTLANAFQTAVPRNDVLNSSMASMAEYVNGMNGMYGSTNDVRLAAMSETEALTDALGVEDTVSVPDIAEWSAGVIRGA